MYKILFPTLCIYISMLNATARVPHGDLYQEQGIWYNINTNSPFNGIAYKVSNKSKTIVQQINYIDGIPWGKYYEWWPNGIKKIDGTYRSGYMHGRWKFFNEEGKIYCAGSYMNGNGHQPPYLLKKIPKDGVRGLWTYWNQSGRKIEEGYFSKNGVAKGNWSYWDKNGRKRLGKKINYDTFNNKDALKHLDGYFLVSGPDDGLENIYTQAHGSIRGGALNGLWTYWDNEGNLKETKNYTYGLVSGQYVSYHSKGHKLSSGQVMGVDENDNLIKDGLWYFWNENGLLNEEVEFSDGFRDGVTKYFSADGKQSAKISYKQGAPWNGEWIKWFSDGTKKEFGNYVDGTKNGTWRGWYDNGQKKYVLHYQNSMKHGICTEWAEDGRLTKDITYNYDAPVSEYLVIYHGDGYTEMNRRNGELSGSWISWFSNGKKNEEGIYKNGKKGGVWNGWYRNGEKKYSGKYVNDKLDGLYTEMDRNGNILKEIMYVNGKINLESHTLRNDDSIIKFQKKNGKLNGKWIETYNNGIITEIGNYSQDKKNGKWEGWFKTGNKRYESTYSNGNKSGVYQEWDITGKVIKNIIYSSGKRIQEYEVVRDGNGYMEINKKNGFLSGQWIKWYAHGIKEEEGEYNQGIKVGTWSRYNINGLIVEELNYDNQGRNLYEITYYKNGTVKEYKDYFSKTIQEYNIDGSKKGDFFPF